MTVGPLAELDARLLRAHAQKDLVALVKLYRQAGTICLAQEDIDAGCFYLTQAYVFALESGRAEAAEIHAVLCGYGREE